MEYIPRLDIGEVYPGILAIFPARMDVRVIAEVRLGEAVFDEQSVQHPPIEIAGLEVDELPVCLPGIDRTVFLCKLTDETAVV